MSQTGKVSHQFGGVQTGSFVRNSSSVVGAGSTLINLSSNATTVLVDASTTTANLVLPKVALPGQTITIIQQAGVNATTLSEANGNVLLGTAASVSLTATSTSVSFAFVSSSLGWVITSSNGAVSA